MEMMENEFQEYVTFHITARDGSDVELAVVDEFDFEDKHYVGRQGGYRLSRN